MKIHLKQFSENVKWLRKINDLTQRQLADRLGCGRSVIGAYEECRAEAKYETLIKMSDFFNVSIDDLIRNKITSVNPK